ncbi:MAG: tyrosine phenol-lyase, partial [Deltaproteobacteria bacterium]|nr:tyrosine phenol-lyase [Deltaproteobacteria bacterium]
MIELPQAKTIVEPFKIKSVEPLKILSAAQRAAWIEKVYYNLFLLPGDAVAFDFLTDSGTGAMSASQWAAIMMGDEAYAGSKSFYAFEKTVQELTGLEHVIPTHQGRASEALLFKVMLKEGQTVVGNTHFDTTRANIEARGTTALDLPAEEASDSQSEEPFKGNINLITLKEFLKNNSAKVPMVIMTVTNNSVGGQPVSMQNLREAKKILEGHG